MGSVWTAHRNLRYPGTNVTRINQNQPCLRGRIKFIQIGVRSASKTGAVYFCRYESPPPCLKACPASTPLLMRELKHGPHQSHPRYLNYTAMKVPASAKLPGMSLTYSIMKGASCSTLPRDRPSATGRAKGGSSTIIFVPARDYRSYAFIVDRFWLLGT